MKKSSDFSLNARLTLGLTDKDKESLEKSFIYSKLFLDKLKDLLIKDLEKSLKEGDDFSRFQSPNWELTQAFLAGQRDAIRTIINLLTIKDKVDHDL